MAEFYIVKSEKGVKKEARGLKTLFEKKKYLFGKKSFSIMSPKESIADIIFKRDPASKA